MAVANVLVPMTVVVGDEDLLLGRAVTQVVQAAQAADPQVDIRDLAAVDLLPGDLPELLSPSLFGERRVLVVRGAQELVKQIVSELQAYAADPPPETNVVLCHAGVHKGKAAIAALIKAGAREVKAAKVTNPGERRDFVRRELRAGGRPVTEAAVSMLVDAVGGDLRELASAAAQLLDDTEGPIDEHVVGRYHRGRADLKGFPIADRAVEGDLAGALELWRYAHATGLAPVLVTSALAAALRAIALVASAGHTPAAELARQLGMAPWQIDKTRRQLRGWRPDALSTALRAVAAADLGVKGGVVDQQYAVERGLLAVVQARTYAT